MTKHKWIWTKENRHDSGWYKCSVCGESARRLEWINDKFEIISDYGCGEYLLKSIL